MGLIGLAGRATAYAVCDVFLKSPNPQWSGSAGAIYPLMHRLERAKLVRGARRMQGRRESTLFSLTPDGKAALRSWLSASVPDRVTGVQPDPLRTRIYFLNLLPKTKRLAFLRAAREGAERNLSVVRADCEKWKSPGGIRYLVAVGALSAMEVRCKWLREVEKSVSRRAP